MLRILPVLLILAMLSRAAAAPDEKTMQWIGEVLLGAEFHSNSARCARWVTRPTLSVLDADAAQAGLVNEVISHLNETLAHTRIKGIRVVAPDDYDAKIVVRFAPLADLAALAGRHSIRYVEGNWGYFSAHRNARQQITRAVVLIASDKLHGEALRHFLLEEITQCLGPRNDSPVFADSIFSSEPFRAGDPAELSARDRKLLLFLYNRVSPGASPEQLRAAVERHWDGE